ncbi:lipoprotein-releasing system permease protein [Robiginitalea myxolifaciens]|uniref:Lipoprotein-releasing system permease protein n=1 Tax=Robiginitalea myxolifaciens TaxID=400055 RepID=A0A1I6HGB0_9FLAO|nr:FtsX-like permease family protein [Robiginitalea myxolifaciens]SFR53394.1 lipoprotein-releasing system permease protein [Robiginitalea myxolifaciens]
MNLELYIARRLIGGRQDKSSISAPIIKIAIAAIALGILMMLTALATGVGLKYKIREKVAAFNGHIQIFNYDNNVSRVSVLPVSLDQEFYPDFQLTDGVAHIQAVATKAGIIRTEDTFEGIIAKGVGPDYNWSAFEEFLVSGSLPDYSGDLGIQVLVSRLMANRLGLEVGGRFNSFFLKEEDPSKVPNRRVFEVSGIYDSGFEEFDGTYIFTDIRHIQRMNGWEADQIGNFEIFLDDFDAIQEKTGEIYDQTLSELDTQNIENRYYQIFEWIGLFDFNIALIIGIMILVGGINMITALLVLILERTPMIGILKALGSPNWSIRKIFLYNAAYLIGIGLLWGNALALLLIFLQDKYKLFKFPNPEEYYIEYIPVYMDVPTLLSLNIGVLLLCLLMLLLPSYIITRISPVRAMQFE